MLGKVIKFDKESRDLILQGIVETEQIVCSTLGPAGNTVIIDNGTPHPKITKDGVSVAKTVRFSNPWKNMGACLVTESASRTNHEAGDGTTTCSLLTGELSKAGCEIVDKGSRAVDVRYGYEDACKDVTAALDKYVKKLSDDDDIKNIATISGNNDPEIGEVILKAMQGIGDDGVVSVKDSYNGKTDIKFSSGFKYEQGFLNGFYVNTDNDECVFKDGIIVISAKEISDIQEINPILKYSMSIKKPLILLGMSFSSEINEILSLNVKQKTLQLCPIKPSNLNKSQKLEKFKDIAAYFGIDIIGTDDRPLDSFDSAKDVGFFTKAKITAQYTLFEDTEANEETLGKRIDELKDLLHMNDDDPEYALTESEKEALRERIAKLTGGIATIFVGGNSEPEIMERIDRYEDALNAVRAAISDGISPGGGTALFRAAIDCQNKNLEGKSQDYILGYKTFLKVCKIPAKTIMAKSSLTSEEVEIAAAKIAESEDKYFGFNAKTNEFQDLTAAGVIDPIKVVKCALKYATSTAAVFLTTSGSIVDEPNNLSMVSNDPTLEERYYS